MSGKVKMSVIEFYQRADRRFNWRETARNGKQTAQGSEGDGFSTLQGAEANFNRHQERMAKVAYRCVFPKVIRARRPARSTGRQ